MLRLRVIKIHEPFRRSSRKITHLRVRRRKPLQLPNSSPEYTSAENLGLTLTDESVTLYSADGSAATYIYKAS